MYLLRLAETRDCEIKLVFVSLYIEANPAGRQKKDKANLF